MGLTRFTDLDNVLPFAGMVMVMLLQVSNMVLCKAALSQGMDQYVFLAYSGVVSTLLLFPFPFIFNRSVSSRPPPLTLDVLCGFVLLAVLSCLGLLCQTAGMLFSSPTLGTALLNLTPAFTFILAFMFRMEKLRWRSSSSLAKVVGTLVSMGGAFVVTFYKGPEMMKIMSSSSSHDSNWILGGFLLTTEALIISASYIIQAFILKKYPKLFHTMLYIMSFGTIMLIVVSLIMVKDSSAWRLRPDMGLVAIVYAGISALFRFGLCLWCLQKTGPLYVSMFKPLAIIFSDIMSVLFLGEIICLGSLIGAATIVVGFYGVMWGKAKEKDDEDQSSVPPTNKVPLLQNKIEDV